jgi:flagellar protein FliO/FliZ
LGGEKLKFFIDKKLCFLRAICALLLLFSAGIRVFAQSEAVDIDEAQAVDPILAAERALTLEDGAAPAPVPAGGSSSVLSIFRILLVLVLVAAAIYGLVYLFKRAARRGEIDDPFLKVLASANLGSNRYAYVLSLGSKAWLVGAGEGGVNLISEVEDKETLDALLLEDSRKSAETDRFIDFKTILRRLGMPIQAGAPSADNIRRRRERLKGL